MNKGRRGNLVGVVLILIGMTAIMVGAVTWNKDALYHVNEDSTYTHDLSINVSGFNSDITFAIDTLTNKINWTDITGSRLVEESAVSSWIYISGNNLIINATEDSQTGYFIIPIQANNATGDDTTTDFEFRVNATNDIPIFSLDNNYTVSIPTLENASLNISLVGSDDEGHYPLSYNISFNNCSFASWSTKTPGDCGLSYNMTSLSDIESRLALKDLSYNDVGVYNITICTWDNIEGAALPSHYNADYVENKSSCQNTTLNLLSSLTIDASDCEGRSWTEGDTLSCTINITTIGANDNVSIIAPASFRNDPNPVHNASWFISTQARNATNNLISLPISILLDKEEVGNWTIALEVDDSRPLETPRPVTETVNFFVDFNESSVYLSSILDLTNDDALYENHDFQVTVTDEDLRIWDDSVKKEAFNFSSNVSWVTISNSNAGDVMGNTRPATINVDHNAALNNISFGIGNHSVRIMVSDEAFNFDFEVFTIEIRNDTAPEWNALPVPVNLLLTEDELFTYNVSMNVSDVEGDPISFSFVNESAEFCGLNSTNFNSNGMINFIPTDCDVGYHNVTIIATDGMLDSPYEFNFTVMNVDDSPVIDTVLGTIGAPESEVKTINFWVSDSDFLIPTSQGSFYNEDLEVELTIVNLTFVTTPIYFTADTNGVSSNEEWFYISFTPDDDNVGDYNVTVNVTDNSGISDVAYFILNITQVNDLPNLTFVPNQTTTSKRIFYIDINATDVEDSPTLPENGILNYSLENLTVGGDFLQINLTTGVINATMNEGLAGIYEYNLSVNDSEGAVDFRIFSLTVHGTPNITMPNSSQSFLWTENLNVSNLEFEVDYEINETYLTYEIYMDRIVFSNSTAFNYTNLTNPVESQRHFINYYWADNKNFTWNFTPDYTDETYGMEKNFTLLVFNAEFPELNISKNWKVNITHTNENISFSGTIEDAAITIKTDELVDLVDYFSDADYFDKKINQKINFTIETINGGTNVQVASTFSDWILSLKTDVDGDETITERIKVVAYEYDLDNSSLGNVSSNEFNVKILPPAPEEVPKTKTSTKTVVKHFSLKLIAPQDVILSDQNYIEVPFSLVNNGATDLTGIKLWTEVRFNNIYSEDIKIELTDTFVPSLKIGQSENYTLKIYADTQKSGKYKVSIFANVTSPKFSDWGDFFIDLRRINESDAEQILLFTEQFITDNPECLELSELFNRAQNAYDEGDVAMALSLAEETTVACENAISSNSQVRYSVQGFVERNFYIISLITLAIFFIGFIFYIYKRIRFNKSKGDYYE